MCVTNPDVYGREVKKKKNKQKKNQTLEEQLVYRIVGLVDQLREKMKRSLVSVSLN